MLCISKIFPMLAFSLFSLCLSGYFAEDKIQMLLSCNGTLVQTHTTQGVTFNVYKIPLQTKNLIFRGKYLQLLKIYRIHIVNNSNHEFIYDSSKCVLSSDILSIPEAFNLASIAHPYIKDTILYFGISSFIALTGAYVFNNSAISNTLNAFGVSASKIERFSIWVMLLPPVLRLLFNIYRHTQEMEFFNTYTMPSYVVESKDSCIQLLFTRTDDIKLSFALH